MTEKAADSDKLDGKNSTEFAAAYKRTVVVSPTGTDTQNGQALLDALNGITDASATKKYLLYVEPGTYDLGTRSLRMRQHVDIHGAGELNTLITSGVDSVQCDTGTVNGASNAELRFLTVRNTTGWGCGVAILNKDSASPRLTHVTAEATGVGAGNIYGVYNTNLARPIMTDVTATASGDTSYNYGVVNRDSSPTMTNVTAMASGGKSAIGVFSWGGSSLTITQSKLSGSTNSLSLQSGDTVKVALNQLVGPVSRPSGTLQCFNNYDENMAAVTCS